MRYDLGEGMLEIGVVLASLYFIARKKLFPVVSLTIRNSGDRAGHHRHVDVALRHWATIEPPIIGTSDRRSRP